MYLRISPRKKIGIEIPISDADQADVVEDASRTVFAARKPERDAERDREDHRRERELDRRREALA